MFTALPTPLIALVLAIALQTQAHRLDQCLQATRLTIETNRVGLSIDVTPGVAIAEQFRSFADRDGTGRMSTDETEAYSLGLLKKSPIELDGPPVKLELMEVTFPALWEMKAGSGVIRIRAKAAIDTLSPGTHRLSPRNNHLPALNVYLVNALKPDDTAIEVRNQTRDLHQKKIWRRV